MKDIGLGWDPNKVIAIPNAKEERRQIIKRMYGFVEEENSVNKPQTPIKRSKGFVMEQMEADANALRESNFRFVSLEHHSIRFLTRHSYFSIDRCSVL